MFLNIGWLNNPIGSRMASFQDMSFFQMSSRYGEIAAYGHLEQIEKASGISPRQMTGLDPETRLSNALRLQDATYQPAYRLAA